MGCIEADGHLTASRLGKTLKTFISSLFLWAEDSISSAMFDIPEFLFSYRRMSEMAVGTSVSQDICLGY